MALRTSDAVLAAGRGGLCRCAGDGFVHSRPWPPSRDAAASAAPRAARRRRPRQRRSGRAVHAHASRPAYQVADRSEAAQAASAAPQLGPGQAGEHPLMPVLRWAYAGLGNVEKIQDYSATLAKRERIGGKVGDYEYMFVKLRQQPFSVYMYFLGPPDLKGQEVIYVEGQNDGNDVGPRRGHQKHHVRHRLAEARRPIAMRNQRYPLTELGILNMTRRLVEVGEKDVKYGECEVKFYEGAKINDRVCTCIEVVHPGAAAELPLPSGPDLRRQRIEPADPLRVVRLAEGEGRPARVDRRVHLPEPEAQQRVHRRRLRHQEPELQVPLMPIATVRRHRRPRARPLRREVVAFRGRCAFGDVWLPRAGRLIAYLLVVLAAMFLENSLIYFPAPIRTATGIPADCDSRTPGSRPPTARGCTAGTCRKRTPGRRCSSATATAATSRIAPTL